MTDTAIGEAMLAGSRFVFPPNLSVVVLPIPAIAKDSEHLLGPADLVPRAHPRRGAFIAPA
jgi:hypothetical protein